MGVIFANPRLLAALGAVAVPLLVHLVDREEAGGRAFPSLMFVRRVPFDASRRRRLRNPLLLALRCLAVALLALAFADPSLRSTAAMLGAAPGERVVVLVDTSYSMQPASRWDEALSRAGERVEQLEGGTEVVLVGFDDAVRPLVGPTADRDRVLAALRALAPREARTDLGLALQAAGRLAADGPGPGRVILVSDVQASAVPSRATIAIPEGVALEVVRVDAAVGPNLAIVGARTRGVGDRSAAAVRVAVTVRNTGDAPVDGASLAARVEGHEVGSHAVTLPPGAEATLDFDVVASSDRAARVQVVATAGALTDAIAADDRLELVVGPPIGLSVLRLVADGAAPAEAIFVEEALRVARAPAIVIDTVTADSLTDARLAEADVVIAHDAPLLGAGVGPRLAGFVAAGGGLLVFAGDRVGDAWPGGEDGHLPGRLGVRLDQGEHATRMRVVDAGHGLWSIDDALDPRWLAAARVTRYRRLEPDARDQVVAVFATGDPAIVERHHGAGRVLAFATTDDPSWSTLGVESGFAPMLVAAVRYVADRPPPVLAATVGETVDVARHAIGLPGGEPWRDRLAGADSAWLELPDGRSIRLDAASLDHAVSAPGMHELHRPGAGAAVIPLAANVDRTESELTPIRPEDLDRRTTFVRGEAGTAGEAGEPAPRQPVFWVILALLGGLLVVESMVAKHTPAPVARGAGA